MNAVPPRLSAASGALTLRAPSAALSEVVIELARRSGVASIEFDEIPQLHTDHTIWALQSGIHDAGPSDYDTTAPLFARGLTGAGLQAAILDDGLENDLCGAVFAGGSVEEAAFRFA